MLKIEALDTHILYKHQIIDENENVLFYINKNSNNEMLVWGNDENDHSTYTESLHYKEQTHSLVELLNQLAKEIKAKYIVISSDYDYYLAPKTSSYWLYEGFKHIEGNAEHILVKEVV